MAARDAQNYRDLVAALDAKRKSTKLSHYNGFSYDKYYYTLARRLLAPTPSFRNFFTKDETGNFKHFSDQEWKSFADEVLAPRNEAVLAPFLNDKTAPEESEKFHKDLDELRKQEQGQNTQEEKKPEPEAEKKEVRGYEAPKKEEPKEEQKEKPEVKAEKPAEEVKPEPESKPLHVEQAEKVAAKAWVESAGVKIPEKKPEIKHEAPPTKPGFAISPQGKVVAVKEKPKTKPTFSKEEQERLERLKKTPQVQARREAVRVTQPKFENVPVPVPSLPQRLKLIKNTPIPEPVKDASSFAQRGIRKLIYKIPPAHALAALVLGSVGMAVAGPAGGLAGAGVGVVGANYLINRAQRKIEAELEQPIEQQVIEVPRVEKAIRVVSQTQPEQVSYAATPASPNFQSALSPLRRVGGRGGGSSFRGNRAGPVKNASKKLTKKAAQELAKKAAEAAAEAIATASTWEVWAVVIGAVVVLVIFMTIFKPQGGGILESNSLCLPYPPYNGRCGAGAGGGTPVTPPSGTGSSNLLACKLTAGASGQQQIQISNSDIASYITDVANKVGIPPSVLAGILAIEHGSALSSTDPQFFANDYDATPSFTNEAFGFAQFEPATFSGYFNLDKADIGSLFGKTSVDANPNTPQVNPPPQDSTMRITSIRDSIVMAAFKIRDDKNSAVGSDAPWDATAVRAVGDAYQGIGSCNVNNYCNNLVQSFQSCGGTNLADGGPTPPPTSGDLEQVIISEFGVDFKGFGSNQLQWAREKLWDVKNTKFDTLISGAIIQATGQDFSQQIGCAGSTSITLDRFESNSTDPNYFKFLLSHELGHYIRNCHPDQSDFFEQHNAFNAETGVSFYANNAASCTGSDNYSEDYADMISYYLNPNAGYVSAYNCGPTNNPLNPYLNGGFPLHNAVANKVLGNYP